ncbi:hypothetical protein DNK03_22995 [Brucella anthropi]|uniref:hypothetical protein n=1 Tax=Brucella TaxID=234 RepID=UPI000DEC7110|nr:hypothetical protein [Brucella anthropi]KAB2796461.1 hypothetical protein F9K87_10915 [Brucella anthropi]RCI77012.1 hypothetical protein DNK03_22995 [Brucella anthropi]
MLLIRTSSWLAKAVNARLYPSGVWQFAQPGFSAMLGAPMHYDGSYLAFVTSHKAADHVALPGLVAR